MHSDMQIPFRKERLTKHQSAHARDKSARAHAMRILGALQSRSLKTSHGFITLLIIIMRLD